MESTKHEILTDAKIFVKKDNHSKEKQLSSAQNIVVDGNTEQGHIKFIAFDKQQLEEIKKLYGKDRQHTLTLKLASESGEVVDFWSKRVQFRASTSFSASVDDIVFEFDLFFDIL